MPAEATATAGPAAPLNPSAGSLDRRQAIADILELEAHERYLARTRYEAWVRHYLPEMFYAEPGAFHRAIFDELDAMLWRRPIEGELRDAAAYAYPRGHGKTTILLLGLAMRVIYEWRSMPHFENRPPFILIVSDSIGQARDRALDIRDQIEGNGALRARYGPQAPPTGSRTEADDEVVEGRTFKWTETDFTTRDGVRVMAVGSGSKVRGLLRSGRRPTLILCDDLENDKHVETREQRRKLRHWLTKALIPTGIEGRVLTLVLGTILHADSLLARLISREDFPGWLKRRYAAQVNDAGLPDPEGVHVLWPEEWPLERLQRRRRKIGSIAYAQEYLNQPIDDDTTLFRWEWLEAAFERGRGRGFWYTPPARITFDEAAATWHLACGAAYQVVVTAWDLGLVDDEKKAAEKDSDYTVGMSLGLTQDDRIEVRRIYRRRGMTPAEVRGRVLAEQEVVDATYVVVENNAAQRLYEIELRGIGSLPIKGHTTDSKKHSVFEGVPGLALLLEVGRIDFCWATEAERERITTLMHELHGLGAEAHDDLVMALWMGVVFVRKFQRIRDNARARLLGAPPPGYEAPYPTRSEREEAA